MSQTPAMKAPRRSSTASNDAEQTMDDSVPRKELSPVRSAHRSKSPRGFTSEADCWRQSRDESPRFAESRMERRGGPEFDQQHVGYNGRRLLSSDQHLGKGGYDDYRSRFDSRGDRRRSMDRRGLNYGQEKYSSSVERSRTYDGNNDMKYPGNYDDRNYGRDYRNLGADAMRRSASLDRHNRHGPNMNRYGQDYYDNRRPRLALSVSRDLLDRRSEYPERRTRQSRQGAWARDPSHTNDRLVYNFAADEQGRFYRDPSLRRRSQSLGPFDPRPVYSNGSGRSQFDEDRHGMYRNNMPRSTDFYYQPSAQRQNQFCEIRRYGESQGLVPYNGYTSRGSQFEFDRFAIDRFGFDRFGVDEFGYDRNGNCVFV